MKLLLAVFLSSALAFMPVHEDEEFGPVIPKRSRQYPDPLPAGVGIFETTKKMNTGIKLIMSDEYTDEHSGVTHIWFQQIVKNLPVNNAVGNLNIHYSGHVISNYDRYTHNTDVEDPIPTIPAEEAFLKLTQFVNKECKNEVRVVESKEDGTKVELDAGDYSSDKITATLQWLQMEDRSLELIWQVNVDLLDWWYDASVSAKTGEVLQLDDFVDWFTYNIYPLGVMDPEDGPREIVPEASDPGYSPYGWHNLGNGVSYRNTRGNNVNAQENFSGTTPWVNNYRPTASAGDAFNFPINLAQDPRQYIDAAITNLFVMNNYIHDIFYEYGFDEVGGNFQANNFGRGGRQNDAVTAHCQDGSGLNNANFATPADGSPGRMRMYVWSAWNPRKDGDLDNGIIVHEYAHGISNRLTGGPSATGCLSGGQSGGMGEGWGDFFGFIFRDRANYNRNMTFGTGTYVTSGITIRNWPYSSNRQVAPQLYTNVPGLPIHQIGCVWCTILYEVYWNFRDVYGFDADLHNGSGGNNRMLQVVTDGMKFQPCRPLLVDARDAILDSVEVNYGQEAWCLAWDGFASRGLGVGAPTNAGSNSYTVPGQCSEIVNDLLGPRDWREFA